MKLSLRLKMIFAFSFVVIAAIAAVVLFANLDSEQQVRTYLNQGGLYGMNDLVNQLESHYADTGGLAGSETIIQNYRFRGKGRNPQSSNPNMTLVDGNRQVLWSSSGYEIGQSLGHAEMVDALIIADAKGKPVGYLVLENAVQLQSDEISPFISRMQEVVLFAGLLAAAAATLMAVLISNQLLKPVKELTRASNELSAGNFESRVKVKGNDELATLGQTFNRMAENLQVAEERKITLTADVAHELRTPIAVQKAQLEGMLDGVIPITPENLETAVLQTNVLSRLVDDLRLLAMADAGEVRFDYRETNIANLISLVNNQFQARLDAESASVVMEYDTSRLPVINTDPDRVTQILNNFMSNALRYGKKGGKIYINASVEGDCLGITVRDEGNGIPESALPHLFERFYRHEKARSRETGGTGLGLAISKKLAILMGGDIRGENDPRGGAKFTLFLPLKTDK